MINLVLGGARSGKSRYAETLAEGLATNVTYMATASADDDEMQKRISHHQNSRPSHWALIEEKFLLSEVLNRLFAQLKIAETRQQHVIMIDCLTLWLSNWLCRIDQNQATMAQWDSEKKQFLKQLSKAPIPIILVSNEVGSGIVPMGALSREFVDQAGWLNQAVAKLADQVTLVVAGLPMPLKNHHATNPQQQDGTTC